MSVAAATGQLLSFIARLITGAQGRWEGLPAAAEQRIYFANHQSHFDIVLIWAFPHRAALPRPAIAARDYWAKAPFDWLTHGAVSNAIYVSRTRANPEEDPTGAAGRALGHGDSLVIFPRTRSHTGTPLAFARPLPPGQEQFPHVPWCPPGSTTSSA